MSTKGGRPNTGQLILRKSGYVARLWLIRDGVRVRQVVPLGTEIKAVARIKLRELLANPTSKPTNGETYAQLADRVRARRKDQIAEWKNEECRERLWVLPHIGRLAVADIKPHHISAIYENARAKGRSRALIAHLRAVLRSRFAVTLEEGLETSPLDRVRIPKVKQDNRERAVLTDDELATYLAWQHPNEKYRLGVLERQTMSVLARCFGGLRTGDIHTLSWEHLDTTDDGAFTWGMALRRKTARPQRLIIPEVLRPILHAWWIRAGKPMIGLVFPALRGEHAGVGTKKHVSHAGAMRKDLGRVFGLETWNPEKNKFEDAADREMTPRERELLGQTEFTKPVDFHSWRRRFVQVLADVGLSAQQAQRLAGHANLQAHERYLRNTSDLVEMPDAALPRLPGTVKARAVPIAPQQIDLSVRHARFERATFGSGGRHGKRIRRRNREFGASKRPEFTPAFAAF